MNPALAPACRSKLVAYSVAAACGPLGAWLLLQIGLGLRSAACAPGALLTLLVIAPIAEETVFRLGLHNWLAAKWNAQVGCLSLANVLVAIVFGSLHALHQGSALLLLTAAPALVFGWMWELSGRRLMVPVLLHAWYNLCIALASCP
ncbi:MAG: JDVT-CTERM system glutamic-type intramembrane protease [Comamonadaceae bacterium]